MVRIKQLKNVSNHYSTVGNISEAIQKIIKSGCSDIFGIEIHVKGDVTSVLLVAPSYIRYGKESNINRLEATENDFTFYEGYLSQPHFLPIYNDLNGDMLKDLSQLKLKSGLKIQWLFRKCYGWKETTLDMYKSYLDGNDYPVSSKIVRTIQNRVLSVINKIGSFEYQRDFVNVAEEKILSDGFQFQLRIAMENPRESLPLVKELLAKYNGHNTIKLYQQEDENVLQLFEGAVITTDMYTHLLSTQEITSLLGGKGDEIIIPEATESIVKPSIQQSKANVSDVIKLLPYHATEPIIVRNGIVNELAEAMKRVGIIKAARLYGDSIKAGVRLTVIQCDIPKGRNLSDLTKKQKDIQAALGVPALGIEQGDTADTVKFTIPNDTHSIISLRELIENPKFTQYSNEHPLSFIVGVDEINKPIYMSLAKLVHLMVCGTTGSGKSVFLNTLIVSLLATHSPEQLKFIMIDPKQVELQQYKGFPHVEKVLTNMNEAIYTLEQLVKEMESRYTTFKNANTKNITLYNEKSKKKMPYIVCVIDEYADLKDTHKGVEEVVVRLGQKARAAGIHLVIATQRPSVDVISGRIKANIPNCISFNLSNSTNYRTVFGVSPSFQLLGHGDGVFKFEGYPKTFQRFQSAIISPDESKEEEMYENLKKYYSTFETQPAMKIVTDEDVSELKAENEDETLIKLKEIIAQTGETRLKILREQLSVKSSTLVQLMNQLIEEGWLKKHKSNAKGYEVIAPEEELKKYR